VNTKLTLRLDEELIRSAKRYSGKSGKSVSRLVEDYFAVIEFRESASGADLTPSVRALLGSLEGSGVTEQDYHDHLAEKHR
jgi:hypothetical protein